MLNGTDANFSCRRTTGEMRHFAHRHVD
jgi:hypothetical protein